MGLGAVHRVRAPQVVYGQTVSSVFLARSYARAARKYSVRSVSASSGNSSVPTKPALKPAVTQQVSPRVNTQLTGLYDKLKADILTLNKARLQAIEQANAAMAKSKDLERRVIELEVENSRLRQLVEAQSVIAASRAKINAYPGNNGTTATVPPPAPPPAAPPAPTPPAQAPPVQNNVPVANVAVEKPKPAAPPTPPPAAPSTGPMIALLYQSGWNNCFIHYVGERGGWTQAPGVKMSRTDDGTRVIAVSSNRLEFVLNDGNKDWDNGAYGPDGNKHNYTIRSPGVYMLKNGRVEQLKNQNPDNFRQYLV